MELRGTDAAGVWATETGDKRVIYHKEPIRSSDFIQKDFWKNLETVKTNLMLVHARATSMGGGQAKNNSNNHPFVTTDKRIGMVHNGTLSEFHFLKDKYETESDTDSEVLLRMFEEKHEEGNIESIESRVKGIENIWSVIEDGAMSVALGERADADIRYLFLFRNHKRPLWIADLRKLLGQIFFFSSPDIWYRAVASSNNLTKMVAGVPDLIEIPTKQIWCLWLDNDHPVMKETYQVKKYELETQDTGKNWEAGEKVCIMQPKTELSVLTQLDDYGNVINEDEDDLSLEDTTVLELGELDQIDHRDYENTSFIEPPHKTDDHTDNLLEIATILTDIEVVTNDLLGQGTLSAAEYRELVDSLELTKIDLQGTLRLLGK